MKNPQLRLVLALVIVLVLITLRILVPKRYDKNLSPDLSTSSSSQIKVLESTENFRFKLPYPEYEWLAEKNTKRIIKGRSLSGTSYSLEVSKPYDTKKILPIKIGTDLQNILKDNSFVESLRGDGPFGSSDIYTKIGNDNAVIEITMQSKMEVDPTCKKEDMYECLQEEKQFLNIFVSNALELK